MKAEKQYFKMQHKINNKMYIYNLKSIDFILENYQPNSSNKHDFHCTILYLLSTSGDL